MSIPVHVLALAGRTPVGLRAESAAAAVRARISRLREHPLLVNSHGEPLVLATDGLLEPKTLGAMRIREMARSALTELGDKLAVMGSWGQIQVPVLLGLPEVRPGWSEEDARRLCDELSGPHSGDLSWRVHPLPHGHAAALLALQRAAEGVRREEWPLYVVGGADSYLHLETLRWLEQCGQLMVQGARSSFCPGEAAGFVALASRHTCRRMHVSPMALIRGAHHAQETKLIKSDAVNLGEGLTVALQGALAGLKLPEETVDSVYCDINGERYRSEEWGFAALRLAHAVQDAARYQAPASSWGDVGAASGALFTLLAVQSWQRGYAPGPRALLWASSEGGLRAGVVLERNAL